MKSLLIALIASTSSPTDRSPIATYSTEAECVIDAAILNATRIPDAREYIFYTCIPTN